MAVKDAGVKDIRPVVVLTKIVREKVDGDNPNAGKVLGVVVKIKTGKQSKLEKCSLATLAGLKVTHKFEGFSLVNAGTPKAFIRRNEGSLDELPVEYVSTKKAVKSVVSAPVVKTSQNAPVVPVPTPASATVDVGNNNLKKSRIHNAIGKAEAHLSTYKLLAWMLDKAKYGRLDIELDFISSNTSQFSQVKAELTAFNIDLEGCNFTEASGRFDVVFGNLAKGNLLEVCKKLPSLRDSMNTFKVKIKPEGLLDAVFSCARFAVDDSGPAAWSKSKINASQTAALQASKAVGGYIMQIASQIIKLRNDYNALS